MQSQCNQYTVRDLRFQYKYKYSARQFSAMAIYNNNIGIKKSKYTWGFNRVTAWGKKLTLCRLVLANSALYRLPEGRRLNILWPGCEGSRAILVALFQTLDWYRSSMVGRSAAMIFSAARIVRCSLALSRLVAEPNQTVIEVQMTDWMMAE